MSIKPGSPSEPICHSEGVRLQGDRFRVERVRYESAGKTHARDVVRHGGSVVMLPLLADQRVCLIRNFRVSVGRRLLELPAGTLEPGEDPRDGAIRELAEETGYVAARIEKLTSFYAAPGILDEQMHLYAAYDLSEGNPDREASEIIENQLVTWTDALAMIGDGRIEDGKTILGLLFAHQFLRPELPGEPSNRG